jgi:hypothetical protein
VSASNPGTPWDGGALLARHLAAVAHAATMAEASAELSGPRAAADVPDAYAVSLADVHAAVHGLLWLQREDTQAQPERAVVDAAERRWRVTSIPLPGAAPVEHACAWYSVAFVHLPATDDDADGGSDPAIAAAPDLAALLNQALARRRFIAARLSSPAPLPGAPPALTAGADAPGRRATPRALWLVR